ncbi:AEC family transporter [Cellulomonas sp. PhB150]|uniref:AEC family transporter n=1 Tax=Cellulomonas sp. PhB150 TaxID=2485188 RepID=UPI000FA8CA6D|nr:AEC family transporter [Cellulomonas sp. PhB150]ROS31798.1 hypothetical protein EDF34_1466 [Cellulomonas sp. PhB150]
MDAVLTALGTLAVVVAVGWVLGRWGVLGPHAPALLATLVFLVTTPALLLSTLARTDLHLLLSRSAATTWASTALVAVVALLVLRFVVRRDAADVTVGALAASYLNAGNLGLPFAVYLLGSPVAVVPVLLFQLLVLAPVAFTVLDGHQARSAPGAEPRVAGAGILRRTASNPIIVATLVGLVLAALPWQVPSVLLEPFALVGEAAAPLALITFGMSLAVPRDHAGRPPRADLALVVVLRTVVQPAAAWAIGTALGLEGTALLAVVAMAALPTAQNVLVYAIQYGRGVPLARDAGLVTTVLAVPVLLVVTLLLG